VHRPDQLGSRGRPQRRRPRADLDPPFRAWQALSKFVRKLLRDVVREVRRKALRGEEPDDDRLPGGSHISVLPGRPSGYHEAQRGQYQNVYLDKVEPGPAPEGDGDTDAEEAAWRTAVDAAPWLVGESEPQEPVPPEDVYDKLKPFKDRVAEDIKDGED
jgi:hypothetical protein